MLVERDTPCTFILLAVKMDPPCMSILLSVEEETPCKSILPVLVVAKGIPRARPNCR
jgi:hypothetical protein